MGLLAPLALAALPLLAVVIALYLLRLRRPQAPVASLHLWGVLMRDREANTLWQRLQVSTLLILQVIALLVLILALARPWVPGRGAGSKNSIVIIDVSASMASKDADGGGRRTRLQAAQSKAHDLIDSVPQGGSLTLIAADDHATVLVPGTDDKARLRSAVDSLVPHATATDMSEALKLAGAIASREAGSAVWVLSDGAFPPVSTVGNVQADLRFFGVGRGADNQGITALSVEHGSAGTRLFVQVANSGTVTATRRIDFSLDDDPWNARTITLPPGTTRELVLDDLPLTARVIKASLAGTDALDLDDDAWTVNRASAPANVLLVTTGTKFLELSLSLLPVVNLYKVSPANYDPAAAIEGRPPDLTVFDASVPTSTLKTLPESPVLLFGPKDSNSLVRVTGVLTNPQPVLPRAVDVDRSSPSGTDPLLKFVDLTNVHIAKAAKMEVPTWGRVVVSSDEGPLVIAGSQAGRNVAVVGFDVHDTDLPLQTAFPLLVRNLVSYLLPEPAGGLPISVQPLTSVAIQAVSPKVDSILVEDPNGKEWTYPVSAASPRAAFGATQLPGVYYVTQYAKGIVQSQEAFAVNLFSRDESTGRPNPAPPLPTWSGAGQQGAAEPENAPRAEQEIWPLVALLGVLLLLVEWLYAQRIAVRRLITEMQTRQALRRGAGHE